MTSKELKSARAEMALTQAQMARLLGMRQCHYSRLETGYDGRRPTRQHAAQVQVLRFVHSAGLLPELLGTIVPKID